MKSTSATLSIVRDTPPTMQDLAAENAALASQNLELLRELRGTQQEREALERLISSKAAHGFPVLRAKLQRHLTQLFGSQVRHVDAAPHRSREEDR